MGEIMDNSKLFYNELLRLRNRLRKESKAKEEPLICSETDLTKLSKAMPTSKDELLNLIKLDSRYLPFFLNEIKRLKANSENLLELTPKTTATMRELSKKLVDINKRNRMLYLPKLPSAALDLTTLLEYPQDLLFNKKTIKITNSNPLIYKTLNSICRDVFKNYRDRGMMDLYVGYPFIKGKINGDDFYIHAPLALFPIKIEKEIDYITLKLDQSKDVTYNSHLLLANYKFKEVNRPLPNLIIDKLDSSTFMTDLIDFYSAEGINFFSLHRELKEFVPLRDNELKYYKEGDFSLEGYAVLGRFSSYSTVIQRDFELMLSEKRCNSILLSLLDDYKEEDKPNSVSEADLSYVGDLNSSQEGVIEAIHKNNAVVVEGPPGTGKSQTITSLVTNYVLANKNVLIVSEKKAALDVVYSRLGVLNRYAMQIDDINDKNSFYTNLNNMLPLEAKTNINEADLTQINKEIEGYIKRFDNIENDFYKDTKIGAPMSLLYKKTRSYDLKSPTSKQEYEVLNSIIDYSRFSGFKYQDLINASLSFSDLGKLNKLKLYKKYENSFISRLRENLTTIEEIDLRENARVISHQLEDFEALKGLKKVFFKHSLKKGIKLFLRTYFNKESQSVNYILENGINFQELKFYQEFIAALNIFKTLNSFEKIYLEALIEVLTNLTDDDTLANQKLLNFLLYKLIEKYEQTHADTLADIKNFKELQNKLDELFSKKKSIVKSLVLNRLIDSVKTNILDSESFNEINHNINGSKRKYNIKRFINKYYEEIIGGVKIWLMTPEVVSEVFTLFGSSFDLVIFDEASQIYIEKSLPTIMRAKKLVVAGDSKQLKPSSLGSGRLEYDLDEYTEDNIALEEESLLDLARYKILPPVILNFHYRSKYEELIAFSNYAFYDEDLYISPNTSENQVKPIEVYKLNDGLWQNRENRAEALKVVSLLKAFFSKRANNETIGVITFNSQQRDLILDLIDLECERDSEFAESVKAETNRIENGEDIGLFVKNIENVQGDERDVIMFSIGYAKNEDGKLIQNFGWLNQKGGENRLNVAITRAKKKIVIVTSINPSDLKMEKNANNGPKFLKKYLEYCFLVSKNETKTARETLYSLHQGLEIDRRTDAIIKEVYQEIRRHGFTVLANVGIGKYSIDLAVKQDNRYILGIEFDFKLFNQGYKSRERDYFRQKYLESRGWHVYRVWSMNWWKSKDVEIARIMDTIYALCQNNLYLIEE